MGAAELAQRTGRSPAALAQTVRRFRSVCDARIRQATGGEFDKEAIIQGRPGYRLNPSYVANVRMFPPHDKRART